MLDLFNLVADVVEWTRDLTRLARRGIARGVRRFKARSSASRSKSATTRGTGDEPVEEKRRG
jgi:hypothetical protein